jgi:hypothetical protein
MFRLCDRLDIPEKPKRVISAWTHLLKREIWEELTTSANLNMICTFDPTVVTLVIGSGLILQSTMSVWIRYAKFSSHHSRLNPLIELFAEGHFEHY